MSVKIIKKIYKKNNKHNGGFTILETMIAITVFLVIVTAGISSLLNASVVHQKSQDMSSVIDNLSFIMEDMSKNLRTGSDYRCYDSILPWSQSYAQTSLLNTQRSCASGGTIAFENPYGDSTINTDQWVYKIESTRTDASGNSLFDISKSVDGGSNWVQLNPNEVVLKSFSGFSVLGAEPPPGNSQQPFVIIKLIGTITYKNIVTPFSLQTSVSQRLVDH